MTHNSDLLPNQPALGASLRASIARDGAGLRPTNRRQTVTLVVDVSSSLLYDNAIRSVDEGVRAIVAELARPENGPLFELALMTFNTAVEVVVPLTPAASVRPPTLVASGLTAIAPALAKAHELVKSTASLPKRLRGIAVLFSDGNANEGGDPRIAADELKRDADLITIGLGQVDRALMTSLASSPAHAHFTTDPKALRGLFAVVGRTISQSAFSAPLASAGARHKPLDPFTSRKR